MGILKNQMKVVGLAAFLLSATFTSAVRINPYESSTSINEHVLIQGISEPITYAEITKPKWCESKGEKPKDKIKKEDEGDNVIRNIKSPEAIGGGFTKDVDSMTPTTFAEIFSSTNDENSDMNEYAKMFEAMCGNYNLVPKVDEDGATKFVKFVKTAPKEAKKDFRYCLVPDLDPVIKVDQD